MSTLILKTCNLCKEGSEHTELGGCNCAPGESAHLSCFVKKALNSSQQGHDGWTKCPTCNCDYAMGLQVKLARVRTAARPAPTADGSSSDAMRAKVWGSETLGLALLQSGKEAEALPLLTECSEIDRGTLGDKHTTTISSANNLALLLEQLGDFSAAEPLYRQTMAVRRQTRGNDHPYTLNAINSLGTLLVRKGDLGAAEPLLIEALAGKRSVMGDTHPSTMTSIGTLAGLLEQTNRAAEAEALLRELFAGQRKNLGRDHQTTLHSCSRLALLLYKLGKADEAKELCKEAAQLCVQQSPHHRKDKHLVRMSWEDLEDPLSPRAVSIREGWEVTAEEIASILETIRMAQATSSAA